MGAGVLPVAVAQPVVVSGDLAATVDRHVQAVEEAAAAGARVVVFPELSLTGYHLDADPIDPAAPELAALVEVCDRTGVVALVGAPVVDQRSGADGGVSHLAMLSVGGHSGCHSGGDCPTPLVVYRKVNLGGAEAERFSPGTGPVVIEVDGWRLGLAICKDTGVPDHAAATAALGIDAYLAGVCEHEHDHPVVAERARRIATDHGIWVGIASFAGPTGEGYDPAAGRSGVWSPDGTEVGRAGPRPGAVVMADVDRGR